MSQAYKQETKGREGRQEGAWDVRLFGIPFEQNTLFSNSEIKKNDTFYEFTMHYLL